MTFRFDKLTIRAQQAVSGAQSLATEAGNPEIGVLHLFSVLIGEADGVVVPLLNKIGCAPAKLKTTVDSELKRLPASSGGSQPGVGPELKKVLERSAALATEMNDEFVSSEHLFLALADIDSAAKRILKLNAVELSDIRKALQEVRGSAGSPTKTPRTSTRRWRNTESILSKRPTRGNSIPLLAVTMRFAVLFRCYPAAPKTIRY